MMPRGIYNRAKRTKATSAPGRALRPEIQDALASALTHRLPAEVIPYVSENGEVRLFRLVRFSFSGNWATYLLSREDTDALLRGAPPARAAKKPGRSRKKHRAKKGLKRVNENE